MNTQATKQVTERSPCLEKTIDIVIPVKNGGMKLVDNVRLWLEQDIPEGWKIALFLVDDGSTDGIPEKIKNMFPDSVTVIRHDQSKGRAAARNIGADAGKGSFIAFFDALVLPASGRVLAAHIERLVNGKECLFGGISAEGDDFWAQYFRNVCDKRKTKFLAGEKHVMTTQNFVISRPLFYLVGKFDERYQHYGFEDRDLFIRIVSMYSEICYVQEAIVNRDVSNFSLDGICEKMYISGRHTSGIFYETHPEEYKAMNYSKVDVRCHGDLMRYICWIIVACCSLLLMMGKAILKSPVPFWMKGMIVKVCSGLFFMSGTKDAHLQVARKE